MSPPDATHAFYFPDTEALARFGEASPQPQFLLDSQRLKVLVAGLARPASRSRPTPRPWPSTTCWPAAAS